MRFHSSSLMLVLHLDFHAYNCITLLLGSFFSSELTSRETVQKFSKEGVCGDFPSGPVVKNQPANGGNMGSIPGLGGSHMSPGS